MASEVGGDAERSRSPELESSRQLHLRERIPMRVVLVDSKRLAARATKVHPVDVAKRMVGTASMMSCSPRNETYLRMSVLVH